MSTTIKTPAGAAFAAAHPQYEWASLGEAERNLWARAAQAAIVAYLAGSAAWPTVLDVRNAIDAETYRHIPGQASRCLALFAERFAKLQAERDEWKEKALVLQSQVDNADGISRIEQALTIKRSN